MRIPVPAALDSRQRAEDTRGLILTTPSVTAAPSDDRATVIELNGTEHRVPPGWAIATGRHGESDLAFLRQGAAIKVLAGDRSGRVHEVRGYKRETLDAIVASRFDTPAAAPESAEVDRLIALADELGKPVSEASTAETDRLVALADTLEGGSVDDAEVARLSKLASEL